MGIVVDFTRLLCYNNIMMQVIKFPNSKPTTKRESELELRIRKLLEYIEELESRVDSHARCITMLAEQIQELKKSS